MPWGGDRSRCLRQPCRWGVQSNEENLRVLFRPWVPNGSCSRFRASPPWSASLPEPRPGALRSRVSRHLWAAKAPLQDGQDPNAQGGHGRAPDDAGWRDDRAHPKRHASHYRPLHRSALPWPSHGALPTRHARRRAQALGWGAFPHSPGPQILLLDNGTGFETNVARALERQGIGRSDISPRRPG
jgi:hypothetical protein